MPGRVPAGRRVGGGGAGELHSKRFLHEEKLAPGGGGDKRATGTGPVSGAGTGPHDESRPDDRETRPVCSRGRTKARGGP
ncbi:hypothetical protein ACE1SV_38540 [Streptomyces sennicomposti]